MKGSIWPRAALVENDRHIYLGIGEVSNGAKTTATNHLKFRLLRKAFTWVLCHDVLFGCAHIQKHTRVRFQQLYLLKALSI